VAWHINKIKIVYEEHKNVINLSGTELSEGTSWFHAYVRFFLHNMSEIFNWFRL